MSGDLTDGVKWESDGQGEFTVEPFEKPTRGTDVILHLREDAKEFLKPFRLREIVKQYSDFIDHPVVMDVEKEKDGRLLGYVRTQLNEVLQEQLEKLMEGTSADYALYTGGADIIPKLTSRTYEIWPSKSYQRLWGKLTHRNVITSKKPETVLSPNVNVGECWWQ